MQIHKDGTHIPMKATIILNKLLWGASTFSYCMAIMEIIKNSYLCVTKKINYKPLDKQGPLRGETYFTLCC